MSVGSDSSAGKVYLVGAGPGDPGLITVRGLQCLQEADLVLYDGLVNPLLLRHTTAHCERTARIQRDGEHIVPQGDINRRLIEEAQSGKTIVRLKGGDPFVFGRGSEEAQALSDAGIPFEIIPGITAATAAAGYAGISLTHRELSSAVAFITGHEASHRENSRLDFEALAHFPGTLVFYMGLSQLSEISSQLIKAGMSETTSAAVLCRGTLPTQRIVTSTLAGLPHAAKVAGLKPPSLVIVGSCVDLRDQIAWFEKLPLFGISIGVTRSSDQFDEIASQIVRLGGDPVMMPMIRIAAPSDVQIQHIQECLQRLREYSWVIFTSVNAVDHFFRQLFACGYDARAMGSSRVAAVGAGTAECLHSYGIRPDLVPKAANAEQLAREVLPLAGSGLSLWPKASRGRETLPDAFRQAGQRLDELVVYNHEDVTELCPVVADRIRKGELNWIGLSSPAIARQLATLLKQNQIDPEQMLTKIATISSLTTQAAKAAGFIVACEAETASWEALIRAASVFQHRLQQAAS
ncbi:MAG: uroporphyrinogen-III C-methyltransferase [Planctomyces sp.]|nr:uroporphyrinogen-III C-methyltransferase [Planctomyces sp.]